MSSKRYIWFVGCEKVHIFIQRVVFHECIDWKSTAAKVFLTDLWCDNGYIVNMDINILLPPHWNMSDVLCSEACTYTGSPQLKKSLHMINWVPQSHTGHLIYQKTHIIQTMRHPTFFCWCIDGPVGSLWMILQWTSKYFFQTKDSPQKPTIHFWNSRQILFWTLQALPCTWTHQLILTNTI